MDRDEVEELAARKQLLVNALLDCSFDEHEALWAEYERVRDEHTRASQERDRD